MLDNILTWWLHLPVGIAGFVGLVAVLCFILALVLVAFILEGTRHKRKDE